MHTHALIETLLLCGPFIGLVIAMYFRCARTKQTF